MRVQVILDENNYVSSYTIPEDYENVSIVGAIDIDIDVDVDVDDKKADFIEYYNCYYVKNGKAKLDKKKLEELQNQVVEEPLSFYERVELLEARVTELENIINNLK